MSSAIGFKQQCPSCGGQVTIKNPDLVGKKVDCPKCKYRFVVESPDGEGNGKPDDAAAHGPVRQVKDKKKPAVNRIKDKEKRRKPHDDDDGDKKGGNKTLLIMAGIGVLVLVGVGVVLIIAFTGDDKKPPELAAGGQRTTPKKEESTEDPADKLRALLKVDDEKSRKEALDLLTDEKQETADKCQVAFEEHIKERANDHPQADDFLNKFGKGLDKGKMDKLRAAMDGRLVANFGPRDLHEEPTNMLPNDSQVVMNLQVSKFLNSPFGIAVFGRGAFRTGDFDSRLGLRVDTLERMVIGANRDHETALVILRTNEPFLPDEVKRALKVDPATKQVVKGKEYALGQVDFLAEFVDRRFPLAALRTKAAIHIRNPKTLIYGHEVAVKKFLDDPPKFNLTAPPVAPPSGPSGGGDAKGPAGPGGISGPGGGSGREYPGAPAGVGPAGGGGPSFVGGGPGGGPGFVGGGPGGGAGAGPGGGAPGAPAKANDEKYYLPLEKNFRKVIEASVDKKQPLLVYADASKRVPGEYYYFEKLPAIQQRFVEMIAMAVHTEDQLVLRLAAWCKDKREADSVKKEILRLLHAAAKAELRDAFGFEFQVLDQASGDSGTGFGGFSGGPGGGGVTGPNDGMIGPRGGGPGAGYPGAPPGVGPGAGGGPGGGGPGGGGPGMVGGGGGMRLPGGGRPGGGFGGPPGAPGQPASDEAPEKDLSKIEVWRADEIVSVVVTFTERPEQFIEDKLGMRIADIRALTDINAKRLRVGDLGNSLNLMRSAKQDVLPMGALPRRPDPSRGLRGWPASERVSWMRELLPYMGDNYPLLYTDIDPEKSWRDPVNLKAGRHFVSQFIVPGSGSGFTRVRGISHQLAVTHFVGMAGIGPDAGYYAKNDPRAGVFGYDRSTTFADITDGASNTIYMIQTDSAVAGPWIAGGGATVRGTSEKGDDVGKRGGFLSPTHQGKQGAWAIMTDGSARFISKDIDPAVFKGLCTMGGNEQMSKFDLDKIAPLGTFGPPAPAAPPAGKPGEEKKPAAKKPAKDEEEPAKTPPPKKDEK